MRYEVEAHPLTLRVLPGVLAVCRLPPDAPVPGWANSGALVSVTRTAEELSVVCAAAAVPTGVQSEGGWRALAVVGPLDFGLTGILAGLTAPLAAAGISIFALSTYDTDYVLVREPALAAAIGVLRQAGMTLQPRDDPA
jgi:hypothetical protein